jgi:hypothetical protein
MTLMLELTQSIKHTTLHRVDLIMIVKYFKVKVLVTRFRNTFSLSQMLKR